MLLVRTILLLLGLATCCAASGLHIDAPERLREIERKGFSFGALVVGPGRAGADNAALYGDPAYRTLIDDLAADIARLAASDRQLGLTMRSPHRLFNVAWLKSPSAHFELVGVVNRMDRAPFQPGSCGEIRFIYRLAYGKETAAGLVYSRLPMTANVVYLLPGEPEKCRVLARQWLDGADLQAFGDGIIGRRTLKSVEINLQAVRWPSTVRPDMAGYAEYLLRVFRPRGDRYVKAVLENTPDVPRLTATPRLKQKLLDWLKMPENFKAIDAGIARLPDEFLAVEATSVALHGTHRLANMPFTQLFSEGELADFPYQDGRTVRSPHGLLRRLNDLSCTGCHQGRTVAGFHFLGIDRPETDAVNAIAVAASPHFVNDEARRDAYVKALAQGRLPTAARPLSVRSAEDNGAFGSHCGLGDPSFAAWTCAPGLQCRAVTADDVVSRTGLCLPAAPSIGSACQTARIVHHRNPHGDRLVDRIDLDCGFGAVCQSTGVGFPGGMCSSACRPDLGPDSTCGAIAILQGFNRCLAARKPFAECLRNNVFPAALRACSATSPCRDDFICAKTASGRGACIPPYFLFQLRVDGHPPP